MSLSQKASEYYIPLRGHSVHHNALFSTRQDFNEQLIVWIEQSGQSRWSVYIHGRMLSSTGKKQLSYIFRNHQAFLSTQQL
eukprot:scaffold84318_cov21-Prasinocladus_malaysianus.AAC.1